MAIVLDSLTLPQDLAWVDEFQDTQVISKVNETLTGRKVVWERQREGRLITLSGTADQAWIERSDLITLYNMASVPEANYSLNFEGTLYTVRFRNEEQPVIEATPLVGRPNHETGDYYNNLLIKLAEV